MKQILFISIIIIANIVYSQNDKTISSPVVDNKTLYDIELNYGISFPGSDISYQGWEDNFVSYSKPGMDIRASLLMQIWKNSGIFFSYHYLNNDLDFDQILDRFKEKSYTMLWTGTYSQWYHHTFYVGFSTELPIGKKFNLNMRIQPGLSYSISPEYRVIGEDSVDPSKTYYYEQYKDYSLSFALTTGMGVKYLFSEKFYGLIRSDLTFFAPKFDVEVNNDGRFYYKDYTPYITSFSVSLGLGFKF